MCVDNKEEGNTISACVNERSLETDGVKMDCSGGKLVSSGSPGFTYFPEKSSRLERASQTFQNINIQENLHMENFWK